MKSALFLTLVCSSLAIALAAPIGGYQQGLVVRMHMGDCLIMHRGSIMKQFGPPQGGGSDTCPEYTLVTDRVVFIIVGKSSNQLVPLAEVIDFRLQNHELLVRVDDDHKESRFAVREMTLRSEWEYPEAPRKRNAKQACPVD